MILVETLERDFLIRVAMALPGGMSQELAAMVDELEAKGRYVRATEDEIEEFDLVFDTACDAAQTI